MRGWCLTKNFIVENLSVNVFNWIFSLYAKWLKKWFTTSMDHDWIPISKNLNDPTLGCTLSYKRITSDIIWQDRVCSTFCKLKDIHNYKRNTKKVLRQKGFVVIIHDALLFSIIFFNLQKAYEHKSFLATCIMIKHFHLSSNKNLVTYLPDYEGFMKNVISCLLHEKYHHTLS